VLPHSDKGVEVLDVHHSYRRGITGGVCIRKEEFNIQFQLYSSCCFRGSVPVGWRRLGKFAICASCEASMEKHSRINL